MDAETVSSSGVAVPTSEVSTSGSESGKRPREEGAATSECKPAKRLREEAEGAAADAAAEPLKDPEYVESKPSANSTSQDFQDSSAKILADASSSGNAGQGHLPPETTVSVSSSIDRLTPDSGSNADLHAAREPSTVVTVSSDNPAEESPAGTGGKQDTETARQLPVAERLSVNSAARDLAPGAASAADAPSETRVPDASSVEQPCAAADGKQQEQTSESVFTETPDALDNAPQHADATKANASSKTSADPPLGEVPHEGSNSRKQLAVEDKAEDDIDFRGALASALGAAGMDLDSDDEDEEEAEEWAEGDEKAWYAAQAAQAAAMEVVEAAADVVANVGAHMPSQQIVEVASHVNGKPVSADPATASSSSRCQRGELGAVAGKCLGTLQAGLWRDDRTNGTGYVYCGHCWDEFESQAEKLGLISPMPVPSAKARTPPPRSHKGKGRGVPKGWRRGRGGHLRATMCGRVPPEACRGRIGDLLWRDEESGGDVCYCDRCWAEFAAQGLVTNMDLPPPMSAPRPLPTAAPVQSVTQVPSQVMQMHPPLPQARAVQSSLAAENTKGNAKASGGVAGKSTGTAAAAAVAEAAVPVGWSHHESRTRPGVWFWYHKQLGKAQFERPV